MVSFHLELGAVLGPGQGNNLRCDTTEHPTVQIWVADYIQDGSGLLKHLSSVHTESLVTGFLLFPITRVEGKYPETPGLRGGQER